jgi:hypothetical protein
LQPTGMNFELIRSIFWPYPIWPFAFVGSTQSVRPCGTKFYTKMNRAQTEATPKSKPKRATNPIGKFPSKFSKFSWGFVIFLPNPNG